MFRQVFIELESNFLASQTNHASIWSIDHHWNTQMEYLRSIWEIAITSVLSEVRTSPHINLNHDL